MFRFLRDLWYAPRRLAVIDARTFVIQREVEWIIRRLAKAKVCVKPRGYHIVPHVSFGRTVGPVAKTPLFFCPRLSGEMFMAVSMETIQQFTVTVAPKDAKGNPAPIENGSWLTDNTDVLALTPSADGLSCLVQSVGIPGSANVQFTADAKIGEGEVFLSGVLAVTVTPAQAVTIELVPGAVEVQP